MVKARKGEVRLLNTAHAYSLTGSQMAGGVEKSYFLLPTGTCRLGDLPGYQRFEGRGRSPEAQGASKAQP
jgi:hypothetical protein